MGSFRTFSGDSHDVERWLDHIVRKHIGENYTFEYYYEHFHDPVGNIIMKSNQYLFLNEFMLFDTDPLNIMSVDMKNEDGDAFDYVSPAVAVTPGGIIYYNTYEVLRDLLLSELTNFTNVHYVQLRGYLITKKS
jgi:hypothetical protein